MTNIEFSSEFDILYNNIMSNQAPGLDDYEKSVFLTLAQEALVLEVYSGEFNTDPFENTELVTEFLATLTKQYTTGTKILLGVPHITPNSSIFELPTDLWLIVYEQALLVDDLLGCKNNKIAIVIPTTHDDFYKTSKNPFRGASDSRVLRIRNSNYSELISKYNIGEYTIRYITKPSPIILTDLSGYSLSINNETQEMGCMLNPIVHRLILNRAVELAKISMSNK